MSESWKKGMFLLSVVLAFLFTVASLMTPWTGYGVCSSIWDFDCFRTVSTMSGSEGERFQSSVGLVMFGVVLNFIAAIVLLIYLLHAIGCCSGHAGEMWMCYGHQPATIGSALLFLVFVFGVTGASIQSSGSDNLGQATVVLPNGGGGANPTTNMMLPAYLVPIALVFRMASSVLKKKMFEAVTATGGGGGGGGGGGYQAAGRAAPQAAYKSPAFQDEGTITRNPGYGSLNDPSAP